ncbi:MAG: flagellar motor protein PomA [Gammaproteobacteria bacterium]
MDLATLIGLIGAIATIGSAIVLGGAPDAFINVPSLIIVFVGSLLVTLMKFSLGQFLNSVKVAVKAFIFKVPDSQDLIDRSVELANEARSGGLLVLEEAEVPSDFYRKAVDLVVDGHDPDVVKTILEKDAELTVKRHKDGQAVFKAIADVAPAMGMIGTLIGLVQMLSVMDDPKQIGPSMAVALLTTLYGAMIANMIAMPIADKLVLRSAEERQSKMLIIDAVLGIQGGQNPRVIQDVLKNYLPQSRQAAAEKEAA